MKIVLTRLLQPDAKTTQGKVKRVRDGDGRMVTVRTLDSGSRTFGRDLRGVFAKNVSKARRDNKAITGVSDRAPSKR